VIIVNAGTTDIVALRGLILEGFGTDTAIGITFNTGGILDLDDCVIRNFRVQGLNFLPDNAAMLFITNTRFVGNADGARISPGSTAGLTASLRHVWSEGNSSSGIVVVANSPGTANVTVSDSELSRNSAGLLNFGGTVMLQNVNIVGNRDGVQAVSGISRLSRSTITGNQSGLATTGGAIQSYLDNNLHANGTDGAATASLLHR
jgi:hypothetical protein